MVALLPKASLSEMKIPRCDLNLFINILFALEKFFAVTFFQNPENRNKKTSQSQ